MSGKNLMVMLDPVQRAPAAVSRAVSWLAHFHQVFEYGTKLENSSTLYRMLLFDSSFPENQEIQATWSDTGFLS